MEILKLTRTFWTFTGFYYDKKTSSFNRLVSIVANGFIVFNLIMVIVLSVIYLHERCAQTAEKVFHVMFQILVGLSVLITYAVLTLGKRRLIVLTKNLQEHVNHWLRDDTKGFFEKAERQCEMFTRWPITFCVLVYNGAFPLLIFFSWARDVYLDRVDVSSWLNVYLVW